MTVVPYVFLLAGLLALSTLVFYLAGQIHDEGKGRDYIWMIDWRSWLMYAAASVIICWYLDLSPWIGAVIGPVAGFGGTFLWFVVVFRKGFADIR